MGAPGLPCEEGVSPPLRSSQVGASGPHAPHGEGAPPRTWTFFARGFAPLHSPSGGLWPPRPPWGGRSAPPPRGAISQCEGLRPSALPKWGPLAPTTPMRRALRPSTPGDFPVAGKVTKGAPRAAPFGIPPVRGNRPLWCFASLAPGLLSATRKDRFATFTLEANRSFVLSKSYRGNTFYFQSVARGLGEELG